MNMVEKNLQYLSATFVGRSAKAQLIAPGPLEKYRAQKLT